MQNNRPLDLELLQELKGQIFSQDQNPLHKQRIKIIKRLEAEKKKYKMAENAILRSIKRIKTLKEQLEVLNQKLSSPGEEHGE